MGVEVSYYSSGSNGTVLYTYLLIYLKKQPEDVGKSTSPMDPIHLKASWNSSMFMNHNYGTQLISWHRKKTTRTSKQLPRCRNGRCCGVRNAFGPHCPLCILWYLGVFAMTGWCLEGANYKLQKQNGGSRLVFKGCTFYVLCNCIYICTYFSTENLIFRTTLFLVPFDWKIATKANKTIISSW